MPKQYYLRARYYDPTTSQFLTRDPAVAITRSPYGYSRGNPLNRIDPTGLDSWYSDEFSWAGDFRQHFDDHAAEFGLEGDPEGYNELATRTIARAMNGDLPVKPDPATGAYAGYDQTTGTFIKFRPNGTPITCMKQTGAAGRKYWNDQPGTTTRYPEDQVAKGLRPQPPEPDNPTSSEGGYGAAADGAVGPGDFSGGGGHEDEE